jgi:hypothetical protein
MKIFIPNNGFTSQDITPTWDTLESAQAFYHQNQPDLLIVEAPDWVFPNWGYDGTKEGDGRFTKPVPPDGWLYNDETGSFEPEDGIWPTVSEQAPNGD